MSGELESTQKEMVHSQLQGGISLWFLLCKKYFYQERHLVYIW
jgi:hypothetical protein